MSLILEETHYAVLSVMHQTLQKKAELHSTVLQHQPFIDDLYENEKTIMDLRKTDYLDDIYYHSRLKLETPDGTYPSIGIVLDIEAYFPPLYKSDHAWNLRNQYAFLWDSVDKLIENMTYSTTWTVHYDSSSSLSSYSFICEAMGDLFDFKHELEGDDEEDIERAKQTIHQFLNPDSTSV